MTLWTLLLAAVTYPLLAHLDVARGQHVGEIVTEIQIDRTVYISPDWCADAKIGEAYPEQIHQGCHRHRASKKQNCSSISAR